jgi:hypothetical protein
VIIVSAMADGKPSTLDSSRVHAILHKPFDVDRVVQLLTDVVGLMGDESQSEASAAPPLPDILRATC